jgi:hypothetical protein
MNVHYTVQMFEEAGLAGINAPEALWPHARQGGDPFGGGREED